MSCRPGTVNVTAHAYPPTEGFAVEINDAVEKRSYPHHARNKVAAVPEPRYEMQWEFNPANTAFKGFGVDGPANRQRQKRSQVVLGEIHCPEWMVHRRPQYGVNLSLIGIDRDLYTFGVPFSERREVAPRLQSEPCHTSLRPTSAVEPLAIHSARRQRQH